MSDPLPESQLRSLPPSLPPLHPISSSLALVLTLSPVHLSLSLFPFVSVELSSLNSSLTSEQAETQLRDLEKEVYYINTSQHAQALCLCRVSEVEPHFISCSSDGRDENTAHKIKVRYAYDLV